MTYKKFMTLPEQIWTLFLEENFEEMTTESSQCSGQTK